MSAPAPASEAEVAEAVRSAAAAGRRITIEGGGTRGPGGAAAAVLSTRGLSGITLYEPGALTLVARAGTPLAEVEAALAAESQQLPFEPWDARPLTGRNGVPTIGGVAATNASGPRRFRVGACRDSMIGVRFVDGTGAIVKNGGRVMKNVTGLDLVKLMAGSRGTLGVITEVAFKVLPRPESTATLVLDGLDPTTAVAAMTAAAGTPFEVTGAAHLPQGLGDGPATLLRLEGFAGSVATRARALAAALGRFGAARVADGDWPLIRDGAIFAGREGAVWRISVKPTDGPAPRRGGWLRPRSRSTGRAGWSGPWRRRISTCAPRWPAFRAMRRWFARPPAPTPAGARCIPSPRRSRGCRPGCARSSTPMACSAAARWRRRDARARTGGAPASGSHEGPRSAGAWRSAAFAASLRRKRACAR